MIASWRGLAVAAVIAMALAIAVALDPARTPGMVDRALVPGLDPDNVTELVWEHTGQPPIYVVRKAGDWQMRAPHRSGPDVLRILAVDPGAISDVRAALRGARWHRRGNSVPVHTTLAVIADSERHVLGIGDPIGGTEQTWIVVDGQGVVVDSWVARALDRDRFALQVKTPLAGVRRAQSIGVERTVGGKLEQDVHIEGTPRRMHGPHGFAIAADIVGELERALGDLTIVRGPDEPIEARGLEITTTADDPLGIPGFITSVELGGSCPGAPTLVALSASPGDGCVEPAAVAAIERAIGRLGQPPEAVVERRPIPFEPTRVELTDRLVVDITALRVDDHPAEPARVAELLAALAAPAEVVRLPAKPTIQTLVVTGRNGAAVTLDLFADHVLARHGEPVGLRPTPGAWNLLVRPSRELRDPTLWLEEPTTITAVRIDDVRYQRGAVIGAWTRQAASGAGAGPGAASGLASRAAPGAASGAAPTAAEDAKQLEALVGLLAAPRLLGFVDGEVAAAHRVTLTVTPPAGAPIERVLVLGAPRPAGCPARLDRDTVLLPAALCAVVAALAK